MKKSSIIKRFAKVVATIVAIPLLLVLLLTVLLYLPPLQNWAVQKVSQYASDATGYRIAVGSLHLKFPFYLAIEDVSVAEQSDTLLKVDEIACSVRLLPLIEQQVEVDYFELTNATLHTGELIDGMQIDGNLGYLRLAIRTLHIACQEVTVTQFLINQSDIALTLTESKGDTLPQDTVSAPVEWMVKVAKTTLSDINFTLHQPADSTTANARFDKLSVNDIVLDLNKAAYSIKKVMLSGASAKYDIGSSEPLQGFDANHIGISGMALEADGLKYSGDEMRAHIATFSLQERSGLGIARCTANILSDSTIIDISKLDILTDGASELELQAKLPWEVLQNSKSRKSANAKLQCMLSRKDAELLSGTPSDSSIFVRFPDTLLTLSLRANGNMRKISLEGLDVEMPSVATLQAKGDIENVADSIGRNALITIGGQINDFERIADVKSSDTLSVALNGEIKVTGTQCNAGLTININKSLTEMKAAYNLSSTAYSLSLNADKFSLQSLFADVPLKELTMMIEADGIGTDPYDSLTYFNANVQIDKLIYDSIQLQDICMGADLTKSHATLVVECDDPQLPLNLTGEADIAPDRLKSSLDIALTSADLQSLKLVPHPIRLGLDVSMRAETDFDKEYRFFGKIKDIELVTPKKVFHPDSISLSAGTNADSTRARIRTGDFRARFVAWKQIEPLIQDFTGIASLMQKEYAHGDSTFSLLSITKLLPETSLQISCGNQNIVHNYISTLGFQFDDFFLKATTDTLSGINAETYLYGLHNDSLQLDTLRFFVKQDTAQIKYFGGIHSTSLIPGRQKETFGAFVNGAMYGKGLNFNFVFIDNENQVNSKIGFDARFLSRGIRCNFNPQAILFRDTCSFSDNNYIEYNEGKPISADVMFTNELNSGFHFYTLADSTAKEDMTLELFNIDLQTITDAVPFIPDISGTLSSDLHYVHKDYSTFACDLTIDQFAYEGKPLGNTGFQIVYLPKENNTHYVEAYITRFDTEILSFNGTYFGKEENKEGTLQAETEVSEFPLLLANAFIPDMPVEFSGYLNGSLSVVGELSSPTVDGNVRFDSVYMDLPSFGAEFHFTDKEEVVIKDSRARFNNFSIYAKGKNPFIINGDVNFSNLANPILNLRMNTTNYELLNAKRNKISTVYGKVFLSMNSALTGSMSALNMNGNLTILGNTNVTYVLKNTPLDVTDDLGNLITFTNFNDETPGDEEKSQESYDLGSMTVNMTLNIEQGAQINADLDENRNNYIELEGGGTLNLGYTSEQGMTLSGRYSLNNGELKYSLPLIPLKTFTISSGSYIRWDGDMFNPYLNITATEKVITSVNIDDVSRSVAFNVGVEISNTLNNMGLSFILSAPNDATVQSELSALSTDEESKYAVAMLITGVYLGSGGKLSAGSALSSYLQSQIDNITQSTLKGSVSVNVGMTSGENNETGDSYTDYTFSFAKRFWNDRITVIIGGTVSDNQNPTRTQDETFIDNVAIEWRLDNSGRRSLKLFYDKNNESVLEGIITETGAGYVVRRRLSSLGELFIFKKNKKQTEPSRTPKREEESHE